jgi:hypothetical protein
MSKSKERKSGENNTIATSGQDLKPKIVIGLKR